jgi:hypothetical protein
MYAILSTLVSDGSLAMKVQVQVVTVEAMPEGDRETLATLAYEIKKSHPDASWSEKAPSDKSSDPDFAIRWTQEAATEFDATKVAQSLVTELHQKHAPTKRLPRLKFRAERVP